MKVYIVLGHDRDTEILGVYKNKEDAENHEFTEYQYDHASVFVVEYEVKESV